MDNKKSLVLVVGAGGSKEVNLPIGAELKRSIAEALNFGFEGGYQLSRSNNMIFAAIQRFVQLNQPGGSIDLNPYVHAAWRIRDGMPQAPSIDNFIHAHKADQKIAFCGKLAIAHCILNAEANSLLKMSPKAIVNFSTVEETWFNLFFQQFIAPFQIAELPEQLEKITIITFNYDRCIEHYFHSGLMNYYGIAIDEATSLMKHLKILHPYGYLGPLPWANPENSVSFGASGISGQLVQIAQNLKTFTEGTDKTHSDIVAIKHAIESARKIAFLGFSFNPQNLELLFANTGIARAMRGVQFFGTAFGLSESNVSAIKSELTTLARAHHGSPVYLEREYTCAKLIDDYSRALMF